jgi:hypothetical protein
MKNSKRGLAGSVALLILVVVLPITGPAWGSGQDKHRHADDR